MNLADTSAVLKWESFNKTQSTLDLPRWKQERKATGPKNVSQKFFPFAFARANLLEIRSVVFLFTPSEVLNVVTEKSPTKAQVSLVQSAQ